MTARSTNKEIPGATTTSGSAPLCDHKVETKVKSTLHVGVWRHRLRAHPDQDKTKFIVIPMGEPMPVPSAAIPPPQRAWECPHCGVGIPALNAGLRKKVVRKHAETHGTTPRILRAEAMKLLEGAYREKQEKFLEKASKAAEEKADQAWKARGHQVTRVRIQGETGPPRLVCKICWQRLRQNKAQCRGSESSTASRGTKRWWRTISEQDQTTIANALGAGHGEMATFMTNNREFKKRRGGENTPKA